MKKKNQQGKSHNTAAEQEAAATLEVSEEAKNAQAEEAARQLAEEQAQHQASKETEMNQETLNGDFIAEEGQTLAEEATEMNLSQEVESLKEQMVRIMADNQNIKRRSEADRYRFFEEAKARYIGMFLPVFDDLTRSIDASKKFDVPTSLMDGLELVVKKFDEIFEKEKVERIDEVGVPFDVEFHEALMRQAAPDDSIESDTVLQVFEPGYKIAGKVVKHAKVIVSE